MEVFERHTQTFQLRMLQAVKKEKGSTVKKEKGSSVFVHLITEPIKTWFIGEYKYVRSVCGSKDGLERL